MVLPQRCLRRTPDTHPALFLPLQWPRASYSSLPCPEIFSPVPFLRANWTQLASNCASKDTSHTLSGPLHGNNPGFPWFFYPYLLVRLLHLHLFRAPVSLTSDTLQGVSRVGGLRVHLSAQTWIIHTLGSLPKSSEPVHLVLVLKSSNPSAERRMLTDSTTG